MQSNLKSYLFAISLIGVGAVWLMSEQAYLPHVDDLYLLTWAANVADKGPLPVYGLSRFYPTADYFLYAPRIHVNIQALWFHLFGFSMDSALQFRSLSFVLSAAIVSVAAFRRKLTLVAIFFPVLLCLVMLHTGMRPEGTALLFVVAAFALLWTDTAVDQFKSWSSTTELIIRIVGKSFAILAPLVWPSAMPHSQGLLIASDVRDFKKRPVLQLFFEGVVALTIGVLALGMMVGFNYIGFFQIYWQFAQESHDIARFPLSRLADGLLLVAGAYAVRTRSKDASFAAYAVGLGSLFGLLLHSKISIATPLSGFAALALLDAVSRDQMYRKYAFAFATMIFAVLYSNQTAFLLLSRANPEAQQAVQDFARQAKRDGRPLLVDEIAGTHGLRLDLDGVLLWTYSLHHPDARPQSIDDIQEGESWIVSVYTIHSWLKSVVVQGFPERRPQEDAFVQGIPCVLGRNSCRFPTLRWSFYLVERRGGKIALRIVP